jgi:hypothetical protein
MPLHALRREGFHHPACSMPSALDLSHPFNEGYGHTSPLDLSFLHHGGCVETHHVGTSLGVTLTDEISLLHASHDETPDEETFRDETFLDVICHLGTPHGESYCDALHYGSYGGLLGLCSRYPVDQD